MAIGRSGEVLFASVLRCMNQAQTFLALFLALLPIFLLLLLPVGWQTNEEHTFMLAHRRVAPEHFSEFSAAFDNSRARILNEWLIGSFIHYLGYETAHTVLRLGMAMLYAASFALLLRSLRLSLLDGLLVLALFYLLGPDLMGGEWLFDGVEAKTFAYALVFTAFACIIEHRLVLAALALVAATYFHFLVGGFWALFLFCLDFGLHRRLDRTLVYACLYGLLVLPLVGILIDDQLGTAVPDLAAQGKPSPDYIYSIIRLPQHVAPFNDLGQRITWVKGMLATSALFLTFVVMARLARTAVKVFAVLVAGLAAYLLMAVGISYLDAGTGVLGKFYLFRPSSLTLLLALLTAVMFVRSQEYEALAQAKLLVAVLSVSLFFGQALLSKFKEYRSLRTLGEVQQLAQAVATHTAPHDLVLIQPHREMRQPFTGLPRLLDRPTLVSWKFAPTNPVDILRWYDLVQYRNKIFEHGCPKGLAYPIRHLVIADPGALAAVQSCGPIVWQSKQFALVSVSSSEGG